MMKRTIVGLVIAVLIFGAATARAQQPTFAMLGVNGCSGATPYGQAQWCFDSDTTTNPGLWYNNAGTFTLVSGGGGGGLNPVFSTVGLKGATSGVVTLSTAAAAGTYNNIFPTSAGAIGALLTSGGGSSQQVWLADGATGTILTGTGATVIPAFSATPTISGTLIDQTSIQVSAAGTDDALATTQGGHINTLIGAGAIPTVGTGTVTAVSTDNAMEVTGATSPATVTFHTAFGAKPTCVCNDETSALGACKAVPNSNGATVVVTTTATDSFMLICIGH